MQVLPAAQFVAAVQLAKQVLASWQTYGAHVMAGGVTHEPEPSQAEAGVIMLVDALHAGSLHAVPSGQRRHAPLPSQVPSCWQVVLASVWQAGCPVSGAPPLRIGEHLPGLPLRLHA
jgi:hypothetical protein